MTYLVEHVDHLGSSIMSSWSLNEKFKNKIHLSQYQVYLGLVRYQLKTFLTIQFRKFKVLFINEQTSKSLCFFYSDVWSTT